MVRTQDREREARPGLSTAACGFLGGPSGSPAPSITTVVVSWMGESRGTLCTALGAGRGGRLRDGRARLDLRGPTGDREHVSGEHVFAGLLQHDSLQILEQNQPCVC